MLNDIINEYRIPAKFIGEDEEKLWFSVEGGHLLLIRHDQILHPDITDLAGMCQHMSIGHAPEIMPIQNKHGKWITEDEENYYVAFLLQQRERSTNGNLGTALAEFHKKGRSYSLQNNVSSPYTNWEDFWIRRTDQVKEWYLETFKKDIHSDGEALFMSVYPYFLGRAENAIQYIRDLYMDFGIYEAPTVCHHRLDASLRKLYYSPNWVIDHPARDIAEWIRSYMNSPENSFESITNFINDYSEVLPLNNSGYGVIYARLLFPSTFFDLVDRLFTHDDKGIREDIEEYLKRVEIEELRLAQFSEVYMEKLPKVQWLS